MIKLWNRPLLGVHPTWKLWSHLLAKDQETLGWAVYPSDVTEQQLKELGKLWQNWQKLPRSRRRKARRAFLKRYQKAELMQVLGGERA